MRREARRPRGPLPRADRPPPGRRLHRRRRGPRPDGRRRGGRGGPAGHHPRGVAGRRPGLGARRSIPTTSTGSWPRAIVPSSSASSFRAQYRAVRPDGSVVWISEDAVLIHDDHGDPLYWLGLMLDVTELVEARSGLREAREQYGALVEQIPAIVYVDVADESWTTTYVEPADRGDPGRDARGVPGRRPTCGAGCCTPTTATARSTTTSAGATSGEPFSMEYRLIAPDGRVVWFQDSALVLPGPDGAPAFIQGVMLDITERKQRRGPPRVPRVPRPPHRPGEQGEVRRAASSSPLARAGARRTRASRCSRSTSTTSSS